MDNMKFYEMGRSVPEEAKKPIQAGRLKGMTDINPMFRIKQFTEMFGPCGLGWWYTVTDKQLVEDDKTNQVAAFVDIELFYIDPDTGAPSRPVVGTGGASFVSQERNGAYMSDECYKMALTDAISVAAKALGIAADVYWEKDRTKYSSTPENGGEDEKKAFNTRVEKPDDNSGVKCYGCGKELTIQECDFSLNNFGKPLCRTCQQEEEEKRLPTCEGCGQKIRPYTSPVNGKVVRPEKHAQGAKKKFGKVLCPACVDKELKIQQVEAYAAKLGESV